MECLDTSLSINLWVPNPSDGYDRTLESICRVLFTCVHAQQHHNPAWLNPTEDLLSFAESLDLVRQSTGRETISPAEFFNAIATRPVLEAIAANLLGESTNS